MRRFVIALAAGTLMSGAAMAADMPVKAPLAPAPMVVDPWTGWYVGGTFGWVDQHHHWAFDPAVPAAVNQVFDLSRSGAMGGFVSGYQKQFGQFVLGLESGYNWFGDAFAKHSGYGTGFAAFADARLRSVWTAGVRLGWAASPAWLFYLNGGYANGSVQTQNENIATGVINAGLDTSRNQNGWYGGIGVDYRIW